MTLHTEQQTTLTTAATLIDRALQFLGLLARPTDGPARPAEPERTPFDREVLASYPYPIAATYRAFLDEPDPRQRCKLLVDTFTNLLKMWAARDCR